MRIVNPCCLIFALFPFVLGMEWRDSGDVRWSLSCDFSGNDLVNVKTNGESCGGKCTENPGCTHFTWTNYEEGTCWLKRGGVSEGNAVGKNDQGAVCGYVKSRSGSTDGGSGQQCCTWRDSGDVRWSLSCNFNGNDLANVRTNGESCGGKCTENPGCTHFTWTNYEGGTCWLKRGCISEGNAVAKNDEGAVCGYLKGRSVCGGSSTGSGPVLSGVLATRHAAFESGACALPASNYAVVNPVALGSIEALQHLKFRPELCGQVLKVDCGHGSLDIIVTNSNYGGGLDLYASTWDKLTSNKPPGETSCTVQLTTRNAFNFDGPRCFYKPGTDFNNAYYHNVGLLNTGGRRVTRATIGSRAGEHRGDNPYYAFDGFVDGNQQILFTLDDGTTKSVYLRDCEYQQNEQRWS